MDKHLENLDWSLLQVFVAVADGGSLSEAARRLGQSQPTIGRQVRRLEEESGLDLERVKPLVRLASKLRGLKGQDLEEGVSTRLVVYAATLIAQGMTVDRAVRAAMIEPLSDDEDIKRGLFDLVTAVFG